MQNGLRMRKQVFEALLELEDNKQNWEMLCSSSHPLVPFMGAGISAWCFPTWKNLLTNIVSEHYSEKCADIVEKALECTELPHVTNQDSFHWMEEIAECIFDADRSDYENNVKNFALDAPASDDERNPDFILEQLRNYIGEESIHKKKAAKSALYDTFNDSLLKEVGEMPDYQNYFPILFPRLIVTTNYDNALRCCYPSLLSYSYENLSAAASDSLEERSWLFRAVSEKLKHNDERPDKRQTGSPSVAVPDFPMLLKIHGSVERADEIALFPKGYEQAYQGERLELLKKIFTQSTLLFLGYGLKKDRVMDVLKELKEDPAHRSGPHFTFLPLEEKIPDTEDVPELTRIYNIRPIYFDWHILLKFGFGEKESKDIYFNYFLGLLLENLARRKKGYPQPLEFLWDPDRFKEPVQLSKIQLRRRQMWESHKEEYVRRQEAMQIWKLLNSSSECPLIAITGKNGAGKSTLCRSIQDLQKGNSNAMQFFYISLTNCKTWNEFCIRIYQELNMTGLQTFTPASWKSFARSISEHCGVYWRSVLILDSIDYLKEDDSHPELWETIKKLLKYWKEHKTRVIFICRNYPDGIPCYTWHLGELKKEEAQKVFFSACISQQNRDITYLEKKVVSELFARQEFQPSSIDLLGKYANSKNDLTSLLEEWLLYHRPGDRGEQTLTRILWNHLLEQHHYYEKKEESEKKDIRDNILWIWGILGSYPGSFPTQFFEALFEAEAGGSIRFENEASYKSRRLTEKTLTYMKNIGLCEEQENKKQNILFENMTACVKQYFLPIVQKSGCEGCEQIGSSFEQDIRNLKEKGYGLDCFRGYLMHEWEDELKAYVWKELEELNELPDASRQILPDPVWNILDVLKSLSCIPADALHPDSYQRLGMVLHYEIETVIRFLCICLSHESCNEARIADIIEIGYRFSHHYHYVPSHAFPLVSRLLQILEDKRKQHPAWAEQELYKLAELTRDMGDIHRLLGSREEALQYYSRCIDLCHEQMLTVLDRESNPDAYRECRRIKARTLLTRMYYYTGDNSWKSDAADCLDIFRELKDTWGIAYYHQRIGEMLYEHSQEAAFDTIKQHYLDSEVLYTEIQDKTGSAYLWKCKGDLIVRYQTALEPGKAWFSDAAGCYLQGFLHYCSNINWRGMANILQAMETCLRVYGIRNKEALEAVYGLAAECYRWLGDIRGLADTLDYLGYGYEELGDPASRHRALNQWMESIKLWEKQGNEEKVVAIRQKIESWKQFLEKEGRR